MKIIAHDGCVVRPALSWCCEIVVAIKKAGPLPRLVYSRQTDQFRSKTRNDDAETVVFISQNIELLIFALFFGMRNFHRQQTVRRIRLSLSKGEVRVRVWSCQACAAWIPSPYSYPLAKW